MKTHDEGPTDEPKPFKYCKLTIIYRETDEEAAQIYSSIVGLLMLRSITLAVFVENLSNDICRCLMSGIASPKGPEELVLGITNVNHELSDEHAQFLADGFEQATTLKDLRFHLWQGTATETSTNVYRILGAGIAKCKSVRRLFYDIMRDSTVCLAPCALVESLGQPNNLVKLQLFNGRWGRSQLLQLGDYLGHEDCKLRKLEIHQSTFEPFPSNFMKKPNKTIDFLTVTETNLSGSDLEPLCSNLMKVQILSLVSNNIDDLSGLDSQLLEREEPTLIFLLVESNKVGEQEIFKFASKLPKMKGLRLLKLPDNPFHQSSHARDKLVAKVLENKTLCHFRMTDIDKHPLVHQIRLSLSLNRAARNGIYVQSANVPIATKLWARILHRCNTTTYRDSTTDGPQNEDTPWDENGEHRTEVLFRLLREHAYIFDDLD